jgi:hypothetical protein
MGIGVSLILIAAGAILTWGVNATASGLDVTAIGVILMIVGLVGMLLSLMFWSSWGGPGFARRTAYVEHDAAYVERDPAVVQRTHAAPRRTVVHEDEVV